MLATVIVIVIVSVTVHETLTVTLTQGQRLLQSMANSFANHITVPGWTQAVQDTDWGTTGIVRGCEVLRSNVTVVQGRKNINTGLPRVTHKIAINR